MILALATGAGLGLINGVLVTKIKLPSMVATLSMNFLLRGAYNGRDTGFGHASCIPQGYTFTGLLWVR